MSSTLVVEWQHESEIATGRLYKPQADQSKGIPGRDRGSLKHHWDKPTSSGHRKSARDLPKERRCQSAVCWRRVTVWWWEVSWPAACGRWTMHRRRATLLTGSVFTSRLSPRTGETFELPSTQIGCPMKKIFMEFLNSTDKPWTWTTVPAGRLCPGSGRPAVWPSPAPLALSGWALWKEGWRSTNCCQRETLCPCPFLFPQSWASDWGVEAHTQRRTWCLSQFQTGSVLARGPWTRSPGTSHLSN